MAESVLDKLVGKFGEEVIYQTSENNGDPFAVVKKESLVEVATFLRDDESLAFDFPVFVTCIDRLDLPPFERPRFEVCFQIRSGAHRHILRLKVELEENNVSVPSMTAVWPGFNWQERETYDMYGVQFEGHPDLRRIYLYEEFEGYPLRKDYPKEKRQPLVRRDWTDEPRQSEVAEALRQSK